MQAPPDDEAWGGKRGLGGSVADLPGVAWAESRRGLGSHIDVDEVVLRGDAVEGWAGNVVELTFEDV